MSPTSIYIPQLTPALLVAKEHLSPLVSDDPTCLCWLYPVPTAPFMLDEIPSDKRIIGGNLDFLPDGTQRLDLLKDPFYLAQNARITAEAALGLFLGQVHRDFAQERILILGWGRIAKCLAQMLACLRCPVSIYARKPADRAMALSLGFGLGNPDSIESYTAIINTAPARILSPEHQEQIPPSCYLLDLASVRGLTPDRTLHARGLPGRYKAEAAGRLIAQAILDHEEALL